MVSRVNSRDGNVPNSAWRLAPGAAACCAFSETAAVISATADHDATLETFMETPKARLYSGRQIPNPKSQDPMTGPQRHRDSEENVVLCVSESLRPVRCDL